MTRAGQRERAGGGRLLRWIGLVVVVAILAVVIRTFVAQIFVIPSGSMELTLHGCRGCQDDKVVANLLTYRFHDPAAGDVVVFRGPADWQETDPDGEVGQSDFVKRVIAVSGQTVSCCDAQNRITVDGAPLTEPYVYYRPDRPPQQQPFPPVTLLPGELWVMGDNRNNSADSRDHGPIGVGDVLGQARAVIYPFSRWRGVPSIDARAHP